MTQAAHPAFPSLPPPSGSSSSRPSPPSTSAEIIQLFSLCTSVQAVIDLVIPLLQQTADGVPYGGAGLSDQARRIYGEKTLSLEKDDLYSLPDSEVLRLTAILVYVLSARFNVQSKSALYNDDLFQFAIRLCNIGDPHQLCRCPARVSTFAWGFLRLAQTVRKVPEAVLALGVLIQRSALHGTFAGTYSAFLEACLITRDYIAAQLVLDQLFIDVRSASPGYLDVMTYYHHAGLIYAAMEEFAKAKRCFVTASSLPTQTASAIQLAAAKRAFLCELLVSGKRLTLPKYTPGPVARVIDRNAQAYENLARDYEAQRWAGVRKNADQRIFDQDCNRGLVDQVLESITKRRILQVKKIYSRLTLSDLALRVGLDGVKGVESVQEVLHHMITTGALQASVSETLTLGSAVVSFIDVAAASTSLVAGVNLVKAHNLASLLETELTKAGRQAGLNREYLKKQAGMLENGAKGGRGGRGDDFDQMMAAEETFSERPRKGVGDDYTDMGF